MKGSYPLYRVAQVLSETLPPRAALRLAERLSDVQWRIAPHDRKVVAENLTLITGQTVAPSSPMVREVFRHFGRYLVEFFTSHRSHHRVAVEGDHHLASARQQSGGAILLSAHIGNWECGAVVVHRLGMPVSVVALAHADPRMDRLFNDQRRRCGIEVIPLGVKAAARCLSALREGRLVGLIGDRTFGEGSIATPLFQQTARLPRGPAVLSLRAGVPLVPVFLLREGDWKFRLCLEPPIWPRPHGTVERIVRTYAAVLERYLRQVPTQWLMFRPLTTSPVPWTT
jgi:KDO2-lipid IV(A) lauroyltransferase